MKSGLANCFPVSGEVNSSYNILMLAPTGFFSDYGCHVRILEEATILQKRGHHPVICTYHQGRDLPWLDIVRIPAVLWGRHYDMGSSWHKLTFDILLLARSIVVGLGRPPNLIHAFLHEGAWVGYVLSRLWNVPLVFDYQGSLTGEMVDHGFLRRDSRVHKLVRRVESHINNLPHAIITSSTHAAQLLKTSFGCHCPVILTVPDGVDAGRFHPLSSDSIQRLRGELELPSSRRIVAYLGKLADYQGTGLLLEAGAKLCAHRDDLHFLIMGYPQVQEYREQAEMLGLAGRVTFTGRIPYEKAAQYLALADIAVAPKISETESNGKLLNYMAMGLPTVVFDTPVAREYLGKWGQYATSLDATSLAVAIESLLSQDSQARHAGEQLRKRALQLYSWEQAGERIERVYRLVLKGAVNKEIIPSYSGKVEV